MIRWLIPLLFAPLTALAAPKDAVKDIVHNHILPAFAGFEAQAAKLDTVAQTSCAPDDTALRQAYHATYDAWAGASHLTFGPMETTDLAFAVQFWPDTRGKTPGGLRKLVADKDASVGDEAAFAENSVAARGLLALERMLFDEALQAEADYACALTRAIARDIHRSARLLAAGMADHAALMQASENTIYPTHEDALQKLYTSLMTALAFNADARVARPLGTIQRPRPKRAEAWRSGRSLRTLEQSTRALADLAARLGAIATYENAERVNAEFANLLARIDALGQPVFDGPGPWLDIDLLRQDIELVRGVVDERIGPDLGLFVGFNARDGD